MPPKSKQVNRNPQSSLYKTLTRFFSGPLAKYHDESEFRFTKLKIDKYASRFRSTSGQPFKRTASDGLEALRMNQRTRSRADRYADFDRMEYDPILANSLDVYSEEITTHSEFTPMLRIRCQNEEIKLTLENLYFNILNIESNLFPWVRSLVKYGDFIAYLDIDEEKGIQNVIALPTIEIERLEGEDKTNPNYVQFQWNAGKLTFENWQVAHFRILGNDKFGIYGQSILDPARRIWRAVELLENAMMTYRVARSAERLIFYVDVAGIAPQDVETYMQKLMTELKRHRVVDPDTGQVNLNHNVMPVWKGSPIPLLDGRTLTIEELAQEYEQGKENWVYSVQDQTHNIVPGKVKWCGKNYTASKMIKIHLDDGTWTMMAPEHPVILRDGSSCRADELKPNTSLMPFYRKKNPKGYEKIYDPGKNNRRNTTHTLIAKSLWPDDWDAAKTRCNGYKWPVVHHKDVVRAEANKLNNSPDNLQIMTWKEHNQWHMDNCSLTIHRQDVKDKQYARKSRLFTEMNKTEAHRQKTIERNKKLNLVQRMRECYTPEQHAAHNPIRRDAMKKAWAEHGETMRKHMTLVFDERCLEFMKDIIVSKNRYVNTQELGQLLVQDEAFMEYFQALNSHNKRDKTKSFWKNRLSAFVKSCGYKDYEDFNNSLGFLRPRSFRKPSSNHKVVRIEEVSVPDDVYCMTVVGPNGEDDRHNFSLLGIDENGGSTWGSGLFVKNSLEENFYLPVRGTNSGTKIEPLPGGQYTGDIDDVKYMRDKMLTAIKIPHSYLVRGEGAAEDKTTLAQKDIRFARTIQRIQRAVVAELEKIGIIHLYTLGFRGEDLLNFSLALGNPSKISELQELEYWKTKFEVASLAQEGFFSRRWIYENIFNISVEEQERNTQEIFTDKQFNAEISALEGQYEEGGDENGELGGSGEGEEDVLLTQPGQDIAPGKRKEPRITPGAKGKVYHPETTDKRGSGARKRSYAALSSNELASSTTRNVNKGLSSLVNGVYGETKSIYDEEKMLFEHKNLIEQLEKSLKKKEKDGEVS